MLGYIFISNQPESILDWCLPLQSDEILAKYDVYELYTSAKPKFAGNYVEGPPIFVEESKIWIQNWVKPTPAPWE